MRHAKYFDKDLYSKFHRKYDGIAMCDVDSVEICQNKGCWYPLAIIEHLYDTGSTKKKYTTINSCTNASIAFIFGLLQRIDHRYPNLPSCQVHPIRTPLNTHCEAEWVDILRSIQLKHQEVCKYAK